MKKLKHLKLFEDTIQQNKYKIQIIKCDNPMYWYKDNINQIFFVIEDDSKTKWADGKERWKVVSTKLNGSNYINKEDCKVIQ